MDASGRGDICGLIHCQAFAVLWPFAPKEAAYARA
jgi:hypothetical protein